MGGRVDQCKQRRGSVPVACPCESPTLNRCLDVPVVGPSVFTVTIEASETDASGLKRSRHARFSLVDLAGSERQKSTTATGARLKEVRAPQRWCRRETIPS